LGVDEFTKVKAKAQRVVDGRKGVMQAFKTLANVGNVEYACVKTIRWRGKQNSQKKRKFEVCKASSKWCANTCQKVPEGFVEIIIEHPCSFPTCNNN
jgi:hypothetical protein